MLTRAPSRVQWPRILLNGERAKHVHIYTDGACLDNPGPGGYGVVLLCNEQRKELSGGFRCTTNNRMELMAAIEGLGALRERCRVTLYTDSRYLADALARGWARRWQAHGWRRPGGGRALNSDLWQRLLELCQRHEVEVVWVRSHAGHPENERCDRLALEAARQPHLSADLGYEGPLAGDGASLAARACPARNV